MTILLTVIHVIVCLVLIVVILIQGGRGQGLTGPTFGSGNVQSLFGTRAADFITKATSVSAIFFLFTCIGLDLLEAQKSRSLFEGPNQNAPIDMNAVKRALEKVQAEGGDPSQSDPLASAAADANAALPEVPQGAQAAANASPQPVTGTQPPNSPNPGAQDKTGTS